MLLHQLILYGLIGGGSSAIDSFLYVFFTRYWNWNIFAANFISTNIGITCSFFMNTYFNFKQTDHLLKRAIKFFIIGYCGMVLSMVLLHVGTDILQINDIAVKVISIFIVAAVQFVCNKCITFAEKKNNETQYMDRRK